MNDIYDMWGVQAKVGDLIYPSDGTPYRGRIVYISRAEDTVKHQCLKTGKVWEKSYTGFGIRYRVLSE